MVYLELMVFFTKYRKYLFTFIYAIAIDYIETNSEKSIFNQEEFEALY